MDRRLARAVEEEEIDVEEEEPAGQESVEIGEGVDEIVAPAASILLLLKSRIRVSEQQPHGYLLRRYRQASVHHSRLLARAS